MSVSANLLVLSSLFHSFVRSFSIAAWTPSDCIHRWTTKEQKAFALYLQFCDCISESLFDLNTTALHIRLLCIFDLPRLTYFDCKTTLSICTAFHLFLQQHIMHISCSVCGASRQYVVFVWLIGADDPPQPVKSHAASADQFMRALVEHTHRGCISFGVLGGRAASGRVAEPPPAAAGASPAAAAGRRCARREDAQRGLGSGRGQPVGKQVPFAPVHSGRSEIDPGRSIRHFFFWLANVVCVFLPRLLTKLVNRSRWMTPGQVNYWLRFGVAIEWWRTKQMWRFSSLLVAAGENHFSSRQRCCWAYYVTWIAYGAFFTVMLTQIYAVWLFRAFVVAFLYLDLAFWQSHALFMPGRLCSILTFEAKQVAYDSSRPICNVFLAFRLRLIFAQSFM